jgi:hypothetical protein
MLHVVLVDPVPEARATAAKSLGVLVERLGEVHFPDLIPGLIRTLKTDTSGVDRQGAAQGLSEVLSGLGMERMEGLLPDIIINAQSPKSTVREGFMSLLVYLPATFGVRFQPHLPKIIAPILSGLSDVEEYVRDAAMKAGRMIITNYSTRAIDLLLPELERGIFDPGWRIRVCNCSYCLVLSLADDTLSNLRSPSLESCCSRSLVSAARRRSTTTKMPLPRLLPPTLPSGHSQTPSVPNVAIASWLLCIYLGRTLLARYARRRCTFGRRLLPTLLVPVRQPDAIIVTPLTYIQCGRFCQSLLASCCSLWSARRSSSKRLATLESACRTEN